MCVSVDVNEFSATSVVVKQENEINFGAEAPSLQGYNNHVVAVAATQRS